MRNFHETASESGRARAGFEFPFTCWDVFRGEKFLFRVNLMGGGRERVRQIAKEKGVGGIDRIRLNVFVEETGEKIIFASGEIQNI